MSLTISTGKSRFVLKMEDVESEKTFREILRMIVFRNEIKPEPMKNTCTEQKKTCVEKSFAVPKSPDIDCKTSYKYKGFLYMRCPSCGKVRGFCMKNESDRYTCNECGNSHVFEAPLIPMYVRCECGSSFTYKTNMDRETFDITCIQCGAPVAIAYNEKKDVFETINYQR